MLYRIQLTSFLLALDNPLSIDKTSHLHIINREAISYRTAYNV